MGALSAALALAAIGASAHAGSPSPTRAGGVSLTDLGQFDSPVYAATAPGKKNRKLLFVVEQGGTVRVIRDGHVLDRPFLDISDRISSGGERGLLSIAFDPDYAKNRRLYAYYTGMEGEIRVSLLRRSTNSNVTVNPSSMRKIISIPHPVNANHNGGEVAIGPDGDLWMGTGDGGSACDPPENAQNTDSLLGKLLRIKPGRHGGYSIPGDNPFAKGPGADEIYAYGLRNPFRFSFDPKTGTIAIGDVGQNVYEEIDYLSVEDALGANFGWDAFEGNERLDLSGCPSDTSTPPPPDPVFPIHVYAHSGGDFSGCAIIGGLVVRDPRLKSLDGRYLYSDSCNGELRSLVPKAGESSGDAAVGPSVGSPTSFTEGRGHRVYVTALDGHVYRLDPAKGGKEARSAAAAKPHGGKGGHVGDGHGGFRIESLGNFKTPTYVTGPKGAHGLIFVVEEAGDIRVIKNGRELPHPFLDIRQKVRFFSERGLLSVAFPPDYGRSGLFYVYYTNQNGDIVVEEYKRSKHDPTDANENSGRVVIEADHHLADDRNGGQLQFGPDGNLYIGTGDEGSTSAPLVAAQDKDSLLGKILRIDPRRDGKRPYSVPKSNPFVGKDGADEVLSYGFRNPFRFSFDSKTGRLAIGDVGQEEFEELDYETIHSASGANFGWSALEGKHPNDSPDAAPRPANPEPPIFEYSHGDGSRCAIIGGYVARDPRIRSLYGRYVYGDLCSGEIRSLVPSLGHARGDRGTGLPDQPGISTFGEDSHGGLYFANSATGKVAAIKPR